MHPKLHQQYLQKYNKNLIVLGDIKVNLLISTKAQQDYINTTKKASIIILENILDKQMLTRPASQSIVDYVVTDKSIKKLLPAL